MKPWKILITLLLFIMLLPLYAGAADLGELRLSLVDGDVQIRTEDTGEWVPAAGNMPVRDGDQLWVPEGARTEIQARNGTVVRLDENTSLDILTVGNDSLQLYLGLGQAYLNFRSQRESIIQLDTPVSSIRLYDPAKFALAVSSSGDTDISVFRGKVYAEGRSGETQVGAGDMLSLRDDYADLSPLGAPDEWEEWNKERDRIFDGRGDSSQYLPDELDGYSGDFDNNGRWVNTGPYGYVWTPTVHISADWAPYRQGRWVWIGGDYVWIANEPWGWAPYHYGRWAFVAPFGWCWVPPARGDVYWAPGYVGWVSTPTYVSWVPLAPQEVYYGYGNYGRHSVNIVNVNINTIKIKNVYKNVHVKNGVTVVHHETFRKGKREDFHARENPFLKEQISVGRPRIEPERATRMPVVKEIPRGKEPPGMVRDTKVKELKEKRRFVRERDRSVFAPGAAPKTMPVKKIKEPKKGDAGRPREPEEKSDERRKQKSEQKIETRQPDKTAPERRKEIRKTPEEKKMKQPEESTGQQPEIKKKGRQEQQPAREQEGQSLQDKGRKKPKQKETVTPATKGAPPVSDKGVPQDDGKKKETEKKVKKKPSGDQKEQQETEEELQKRR